MTEIAVRVSDYQSGYQDGMNIAAKMADHQIQKFRTLLKDIDSFSEKAAQSGVSASQISNEIHNRIAKVLHEIGA